MSFLPYAVVVWLFLIGLYGMVTSRNLIHMVICLEVAVTSTDLLLLAIGYHAGAGAPVFASVPVGTPAVDPVVQAPTLTDVVVGATVTALLLSLAVQTHKRTATLDPEDPGLHPVHG